MIFLIVNSMKNKQLENEMIRDEYGKGKPWAPILIIVAAYLFAMIVFFGGIYVIYRLAQR